jgi:4'-phosphopantetheinyl transferase
VRATAGSVHVWRADLAAIDGGLEDLLCADERARAAGILSGHRRVLWSRSRGFLRALLGRYLDRPPRELRFVLGPHGKPALSGEGAPEGEDLRFNLSHSGRLALIAVTVGREVGVDVETARDRDDPIAAHRRGDQVAIAARVLGREQAERLAALDPPTREREFMRAWVTYEAAVKCLGLGLFTRPEDSTQTPPKDSTQTDPWTAELDVGPDVYAAVAVDREPCELRLRDWRA